MAHDTAQETYARLCAVAPDLYEEIEDAYSWDDEDYDENYEDYDENYEETWEGATEKLHDMLVRRGFDVLAYGGSRVVVRVGPSLVAKVAAFFGGVEQNRSEAALWESAATRPRVANLLVPVRALSRDGLVLLADMATPCVTRDGRNPRCSDEALEAAQERVRKQPLLQGLLEGDLPFNWGIHDGRLKLLDYGL